jgi:hypothetical protein
VAFRFALVALDADVQLNVGDLEPEAAARSERFGLLDLREAEQPAVEFARTPFLIRRDAKLHVVEPFDVDFHA